jgi:hopene-associated glycosyltransferase HpnB
MDGSVVETSCVAAAALSLATWLYLLAFRGAFWRDGPYINGAARPREDWPAVVAIVPARNEAETIAATIASLGAQHYRGDFSIILVDDQSADGTLARARAASGRRPFFFVTGVPLPAGWTGKLWAVAQGVEEAQRIAPDARYIWLTDADIVHQPPVLTKLVAKAEDAQLGLVSQMVMLRCASAWERLLIPAFIFFFKKLYPFAWINDPARRIAGAAGGSMLVRRDMLEMVGGIAAIKGEIIDDCALARAIKPHQPIWLGLTRESHSARRYDRLADIWNMVARTAFVQLRHSLVLVVGTVAGMAVIYMVPPLATVGGLIIGSAPLTALGLAAWGVMALAYAPTLRLYRIGAPQALLLPLAALLYTAMTVASAWRSLSGRGARWKGRSYRRDVTRAASHE